MSRAESGLLQRGTERSERLAWRRRATLFHRSVFPFRYREQDRTSVEPLVTAIRRETAPGNLFSGFFASVGNTLSDGFYRTAKGVVIGLLGHCNTSLLPVGLNNTSRYAPRTRWSDRERNKYTSGGERSPEWDPQGSAL
jgi:hypothetical protein